MDDVMSVEKIENRIYTIRGQKVILDFDLAELYRVETKYLKRQVNRNIERFPIDFLIKMNKSEYDFLRCQFGTLKRGEHVKYLPYAFTEQGVAMLSSVLKSPNAIEINIHIRGKSDSLSKQCQPQKLRQGQLSFPSLRFCNQSV